MGKTYYGTAEAHKPLNMPELARARRIVFPPCPNCGKTSRLSVATAEGRYFCGRDGTTWYAPVVSEPVK